MSSSVVYPSNFDVSKISISAPKTHPSGAKQAYLNYGSERLIMQTSINMSIPFGLSVYDKAAEGPEYSIDLSFRGMDNRADIKEFKDVMDAIDGKMIDEGIKNSKVWFKSDLSREVIKAFYTPCVKYSKDKEGNIQPYPPNLKVKLRRINGEFETKFFDVNGNAYRGVPVEELMVKGVQVTAIIECVGVWFAGSKYGLTWRAKQIAIHKLPERIPEFAFKFGNGQATPTKALLPTTTDEDEDDEDDNHIEDDAVFSKPSVVSAMMPKAQEVDDSDGDDVEPIQVPKKTVVKKKVIAKK